MQKRCHSQRAMHEQPAYLPLHVSNVSRQWRSQNIRVVIVQNGQTATDGLYQGPTALSLGAANSYPAQTACVWCQPYAFPSCAELATQSTRHCWSWPCRGMLSIKIFQAVLKVNSLSSQ